MSTENKPQKIVCPVSCRCAPRWGRRSASHGDLHCFAWLSTVFALVVGTVLRLWMRHQFPQTLDGDPQIYSTLAKNILLHGQFALPDGSGLLHSTLIRLPGYPLLLAAIFRIFGRIFGIDNYSAVISFQIALDLASCLLLASFVRRLTQSISASRITLWLAVLCPFTAIYTAAILAETASLFAISLALWATIRFIQKPHGCNGFSLSNWFHALVFTFAISSAALLRPDGALLGIALAPALLWGALKTIGSHHSARLRLMRIAIVCTLLALAPFAAWTLRNWNRFHIIEPLAPRYATDPGEPTLPGWQRWVKTWCLDSISTNQIYWNLPDDPINQADLPTRAFDSRAQQAETAQLIDDYNRTHELTPQLDARFAHLADERIATNPLRYYLWLPLGRMADMWLRPRVENLPIDLDWWVYAHHRFDTRVSWAYVVLNLFYLVLGIIGLCLRPQLGWAMLAYFVLRSALLCTIEAPETRYTLECFPMLFALGGIALSRMLTTSRSTQISAR